MSRIEGVTAVAPMNWSQDPAYEEGLKKGFESESSTLAKSHERAREENEEIYRSKGLDDIKQKGPSFF